MSSEAITQNDLREILSRTVGSVPSEFRKLLWTNPSNTFNTGAILNHGELEGYDEVEILAAGFQTSNYVYSRCPIGQDGLIQCWTTSPDYPSNASTFMNSASRHYTTSVSGGITFGNGQMTYGGSAYQNWNSRAVPLKVYGIKYERVAPPQVDASDYVIEQGTNANGSYRKWNSGTMEQWGLEASASASAHNVSFPEAFISTAYVVVCSNTSGVQANFMPSSTNAAYFTVYPTASVQLFWIAIGKWK